MLLLVAGMSPSELVASSISIADGLDVLLGTGFDILLRHSVSPLFCRAANLLTCHITTQIQKKNIIKTNYLYKFT
jgi:hypothetical protein